LVKEGFIKLHHSPGLFKNLINFIEEKCKNIFFLNLIKYLYNFLLSLNCNTIIVGEIMTEFIWYWTKGNSKVYTRQTEVAEEAMKNGLLVLGKRVKPNIIKY